MNTETKYAKYFYDSVSNDVDTLKKNVAESPFSSVARFLLLYNYKKNDASFFEKSAKQSAIYFNDIPWIQYQLSGIQTSDFSFKENREDNNVSNYRQTLEHDEIQEMPSTVDERIIQNFNPKDEIANHEGNDVSDYHQTLGHDEVQEIPSTVDERIIQNFNPEDKVSNHEGNDVSDYHQTLGHDEIQEIPSTVDERITQNFNPEDEIANHEGNDVSDYHQTLGHDEIQEIPSTVDERITQNFNPEDEVANHEGNDVSGYHQTLGHDEIPSTAEERPPDLIRAGINQNSNQDSEDEEEPISFEPLHTVDYFASQGIKITQEALENDHLGQQVKSFTAWLKSMKKLHPGQLPEQNEVIEKIIQSSAEASNQNANVLTEAMAEVLMKQGKREKAVEMYQKLSLMNPSKNAYFAAKIENLKTT